MNIPIRLLAEHLSPDDLAYLRAGSTNGLSLSELMAHIQSDIVEWQNANGLRANWHVTDILWSVANKVIDLDEQDNNGL